MRITVNLATRPFVELKPVYQRLRIWMGALLILAIPLWFLARVEQKKADVATARVRSMHGSVQQMQRQQQSYQALMRQPQNAAVLTQSDYLNDLFRHKAFSWTATMTDLETVLPTGVQVLSIEPVVAADGEVTIRLRVSGARDRAVELVKNLERSRHFASPRLAGEALTTATGPHTAMQPINAGISVNFDILADYRPLSEAEEKEASSKEKASSTEKSAAEPAAKKKTQRQPGNAGPGGATPGKAAPGSAAAARNKRGAQ